MPQACLVVLRGVRQLFERHVHVKEWLDVMCM